MTVYELFFELAKLILKGKGKYRVVSDFVGYLEGVFNTNEEDEKEKRVVLW